MEYDLNSSINLKTTPNIPRSNSFMDKPNKEKEKEKANSKRKINKSITRRYSMDSINIKKTSLDTNIQVHIRVKPLTFQEESANSKSIINLSSEKKLIFAGEKEYEYDYVYSENVSNTHIFNKSIQDNIIKSLDGYNLSIMGSGKTYTMGTNNNNINNDNEHKGILQESIDFIFNTITTQQMSKKRNNTSLNQSLNNSIGDKSMDNINIEVENKSEYIIRASFLEIYNEEIVDLLNLKTPSKHIIIRDINNVNTISGLSLINVNEPEDCFNLLNQGITNRKTSSTNMNLSSSRSHAIFTLHFEKIAIINSNNNLNDSITANEKNLPTSFKINFIDLAGSERLSKTGATGERFKESISINSGLLALSKVIMCLSENNLKTYVPYRDSKLTKILKDSLNGNSITLIIACISSSEYNQEETLNTLNYASFAKSIKISPMMNLNLNYHNNNNNLHKEKYEELISKLKTQNSELIKVIENVKIDKENSDKEMEIQRLRNMVKMLKNKKILKKNFEDFENEENLDLLKSGEIQLGKVKEIDLISSFNDSGFPNYDDEDEDIGKKEDKDNVMNKIKENNILVKENYELKNKLTKSQKLLKSLGNLQGKSLEKSEDDLSSKFAELDQLTNLNKKKDNNNNENNNDNDKEEKYMSQDLQKYSKNMGSEISIKDLKALELDESTESKLEEESNFLINYDNDQIMQQLSDSMGKPKDENQINQSRENNTKLKMLNPLFNSKVNLLDNFGSESNNNFMDFKFKNIPDTPTLLTSKNPTIENLNLQNNNLNESIEKKNSNLNFSTINKNDDTLLLDYNSNLSNNNKSANQNRNKNKKKFNKTDNKILNKSHSPIRIKHNKILNNSYNYPTHNNYNNFNLSKSTIQNDSKFHNTTYFEQEKSQMNLSMALISSKIMKLKDYQKTLREKINQKEIEKKQIIKSKNEEINYIKKNANDNVKNVLSLQKVIDKNKDIMDKSEKTINELKKELRNKSKDFNSFIDTNNNTNLDVNNCQWNKTMNFEDLEFSKSIIFNRSSYNMNKYGHNKCANSGLDKSVTSIGMGRTLNNKFIKSKRTSCSPVRSSYVKNSSMKEISKSRYLDYSANKEKSIYNPQIISKTRSNFSQNAKNSSTFLHKKSLNTSLINLELKNYATKNTKIIEKKIVDKVKKLLGELEGLFLEKNRCVKRMTNLQNDKKEIITLKEQNVLRYTTRLNALFATKLKIENTIKAEENYSFNPNLNLKDNSILNITSSTNHTKFKLITELENYNSDKEKSKEKNLLNSTTNSKEKYSNINLANNSYNYKQNIQKLTAVAYKISAVKERLERIKNLHESTLDEIIFSENIISKQNKKIEMSLGLIQKQLFRSEYETNVNIKSESEISLENLQKEITAKNVSESVSGNDNENNLIIPKEKIDFLFEKLFSLNKEKEINEKKLIFFEEEKEQKDKYIKDLEKILGNNIDKNNYRKRYDSIRNNLNTKTINNIDKNKYKKMIFSNNNNNININNVNKKDVKSYSVEIRNNRNINIERKVNPKLNLSKDRFNNSIEKYSKEKIYKKATLSNSIYRSNANINITTVKSYSKENNNIRDKRSGSVAKKTGLPPVSGGRKKTET